MLQAKNAIAWSLLGRPGDADKTFELSRDSAIDLYKSSLTGLEKAKLAIDVDEVTLTPTDDLIALVKKSMELAAAEGGEGA